MGNRRGSTKRDARSDISNKAVIVILLFVIVASMVSLGVYVVTLNSVSPPQVIEGSGTQQGVVKLNVIPRPALNAQGAVTLQILERPGDN